MKCRTPEGAFYAFADCRGLYGLDWGDKSLANDEDIAFWLLDKAHVAAVPGGAFGAPGLHALQLRDERGADREGDRVDTRSDRGRARLNRPTSGLRHTRGEPGKTRPPRGFTSCTLPRVSKRITSPRVA